MFNKQPAECELVASQALQELQQGNLQKAWLLLQASYERGCHDKGIVHIGFGGIYEKQNTLDKAYAAFDYAVYCDPSPQAYNNRGRISLMAEQSEAAILDFKETIKLQPDNARAYFNLGGVYMQQNLPEKSLPFLHKAMELGYAPSKQAILDVQKQIANPGIRKVAGEQQSPEKQQISNVFLLAKFAYRTCGRNLQLSLTNESSLFGLRSEQKISTQVIWDTTIEKLHEFDKSGFQGERVGATLEFFEPSNFLIRITTPSPDTHELSLWKKKKIGGVPNDTYVKQIEHTWRGQQSALLEKLTEILKAGIIKKQGRTLVYQ
ncbi:MAG: tetratricopeptide repeat protein [Chloroflexota bacterium]